MSRSQESYFKKEVRNKKEKKRKEKEKKKLERKENDKQKSPEEMFAYVDEFGNISSTPPDPTKKKEEIKVEDIEISVPKQTEADKPDPIRGGKVNYFNNSKGYGFIVDGETRISYFFHVNNTLEAVDEGDSVIFEIGNGAKGPVALNVKLK